MNFFKGMINVLVFMSCVLATMLVIPECSAAGNNDQYLPVSAAWSRTAVALKPADHFGSVVDCVIVDADREIVDRQVVELDWRRSVIFRSPQAVEFGALGYCRKGGE